MNLLWNTLLVSLLAECALVLLLVLPMPSNALRGALTRAVASLWDAPLLRYASIAVLALDAVFFVLTLQDLSTPMRAFWATSIDVDCERRLQQHREERNAAITGFSLFMGLVLRRLCDIQLKLHQARTFEKAAKASGLAVAQPVQMGQPVKSHQS